MQLLDLTLPTAAENLAADEALLNMCEEGFDVEILRFWEPETYFVVLGSTNKTEAEVDTDACRTLGVPLYRRASGGGAVLQGPGSMCYALILRIDKMPELGGIAESNRHIMDTQRDALQPIIEHPIEVKGFTDLTVGGRKFSGNSQRRKQKYLLFHGTLLLDFDLTMIARTLRMPVKRPEYRGERAHKEFLTNLHLAAHDVKRALREAWEVEGELSRIPFEGIRALREQRYDSKEWIHRR